MQKLTDHLWLGHIGTIRNLRQVLNEGIAAVVDLAFEEPLPTLTRDLLYCRFPLIDGSGNPPWLLQAAVQGLVQLLEKNIPTLLYCSVGRSRSPCVAAMALAKVRGASPDACLEEIAQISALDISRALWHDLKTAIA